MAIGAGAVFTYGIADDLFYKWHQRKNNRKKLEGENHRIEKPRLVRPDITSKPLVRGYDSRAVWISTVMAPRPTEAKDLYQLEDRPHALAVYQGSRKRACPGSVDSTN
jgi:hypothetical protein